MGSKGNRIKSRNSAIMIIDEFCYEQNGIAVASMVSEWQDGTHTSPVGAVLLVTNSEGPDHRDLLVLSARLQEGTLALGGGA